MCTGAEVAMLAMAAGGTAMSMDAQNDAAKEQARAAGDRARTADEFNRKAGTRVSQEVERLKSSTDETEEKTAENDFMTALRNASQRQGASTSAPMGNVSERFTQDQVAGSKAIKLGDRGAARSLARIDAPFMQRVREGTGASRTVSDLSVLGGAQQGQDFLQQLRMSMIQPDAAQMAAGSLMSSGAQAYAGRAKPVKTGTFRGGVDMSTMTPGGGYGGGMRNG
jgi:hypothetical protein